MFYFPDTCHQINQASHTSHNSHVICHVIYGCTKILNLGTQSMDKNKLVQEHLTPTLKLGG